MILHAEDDNIIPFALGEKVQICFFFIKFHKKRFPIETIKNLLFLVV